MEIVNKGKIKQKGNLRKPSNSDENTCSPSSNQYLVSYSSVTPGQLSPCIIAELDGIRYGMSLWSFGISCPSCAASQLLCPSRLFTGGVLLMKTPWYYQTSKNPTMKTPWYYQTRKNPAMKTPCYYQTSKNPGPTSYCEENELYISPDFHIY